MTEPLAYYNENDPDAVLWLEENIRLGLVAPGHVDRRDIREVQPNDLKGYTQHHFFAGIGGWSLSARMAGWVDARPLWSASLPCQPFSAAGLGLGTDDSRHLWPDFYRLCDAWRPPVLVGEQVSGEAGLNWFDGVGSSLEAVGYACRTVDIPACAVDSPQQRNRLYWVAVALALLELEHSGSDRGGEGVPYALRPRGNAPVVADEGDGSSSMAGGPRGGRRGVVEVGGPEGREAPRGDDEGERSGDMADSEGVRSGTGLRGRGPGGGGRGEPANRDGGELDSALGAGLERLEQHGDRAAGREPGPGRPTPAADDRGGGGDMESAARERGEISINREMRQGKGGQSPDDRGSGSNVPHATGALVDGEGERRGEGIAESGVLGGGSTPARSNGAIRPMGDGDIIRKLESLGVIREGGGWIGDSTPRHGRNGSWWSGADWIICHDQKARRVADARAPLLVNGFPNRILAWRGFGNAIVAPLAAESIASLMDILPPWEG